MDYFTFGYATSSTSSGESNEIEPMAVEPPPEINVLLDQYGTENTGLVGGDMWFQWDQDCMNDWKLVAQQPDAPNAQKNHQDAKVRPQCQAKEGSETDEKRYHRRRAQNRASQRLFRERKLNYVKGIEAQLENLNEKYQDLLVSFKTQANDNMVLRSKIAKLNFQTVG